MGLTRWVLIIAGIACFYYAVHTRRDTDLEAHGVRGVATVEGVNVEQGHKVKYRPTWGYNAGGQHFQLVGEATSTPWQMGRTEVVIYDRANPAHAMIDADEGWGMTILAMIGGVVCILIGLMYKGMDIKPGQGWVRWIPWV